MTERDQMVGGSRRATREGVAGHWPRPVFPEESGADPDPQHPERPEPLSAAEAAQTARRWGWTLLAAAGAVIALAFALPIG
ncbi:hypothetical protein [Microbacterium excoecariae]|uniref:hypothetical protein n=1 Tax=Microbacterium excoecariae TaxID=2715210 RepID=UPI0014086017|nr:hypothetical protein [Microbacterium excoecariae]NHI15852.1 hypothetical protein [Microbacterium excoecariae]